MSSRFFIRDAAKGPLDEQKARGSCWLVAAAILPGVTTAITANSAIQMASAIVSIVIIGATLRKSARPLFLGILALIIIVMIVGEAFLVLR